MKSASALITSITLLSGFSLALAGEPTTTTQPKGTTTTTTLSKPTTTTTTLPKKEGFTRTPGFYKNRPSITLSILDGVGSVEVCGFKIDNVDVGSPSSALEAICVSPEGDKRLALIRALTAAALTEAAGGADFGGSELCNMVCADADASGDELSACINVTKAFNESGDNEPAPFGGGAANSGPCKMAHETPCTVPSCS